MKNLMMKINREAVDEDRNISNRIRDLEYTAVRMYKNPELKPVENKDTAVVFRLTQYINEMERDLVDIGIDLEGDLNKVIADIADSPEKLIAKPINVLPIGPIRPKKQGVVAVGSGMVGGSEGNNNITRLVKNWNSFINYLKNFMKVDTMSQSDLAELYTTLDSLTDSIEKNINTILIIENNGVNNKHNYEKRILETLDDRILSRNLSKINLNEIDAGRDELNQNVNELSRLALSINTDKARYETEVENVENTIDANLIKKREELENLKTQATAWKKLPANLNKTLNQYPDYVKNTRALNKAILALEDKKINDVKNIPLGANRNQYETLKNKIRGRGEPIRRAIHFNDELNDLNKFYS